MINCEAEKMLDYTKNLLAKEDYREWHMNDAEKDFVEIRNPDFADTIMHVIGKINSGLYLEMEKFCEYKSDESISKKEIVEAREKIYYTAFQELFEKSARQIEVSEKFHNYQVIAVDGMVEKLARTPKLMEMYRAKENVGFSQFYALYAYDIMNKFYIASNFSVVPSNERAEALELLERLFTGKKHQIWIFDRSFPAVELIQQLDKMGLKYLMRVSKSFMKEVNQFRESDKLDEEIQVNYTKKRANSRVRGDFPYNFLLRSVRIQLKSEDEICITNLRKNMFSTKDIGRLYNLRWPVATRHHFLKSSDFIEEFTGKTKNTIKQDFYAALWAKNYMNMILMDQLPIEDLTNQSKNSPIS